MTKTLRSSAMIALIAAALTSCGGGDSGDGNGGDPPREDGGETPQTCGNGACDSGESCGNCGDCACSSGQTCSGGTCVTDNTPRCGDGRCDAAASETCMSCAEDCGCPADRRCHAESGTCVSNNPLIETMPGQWRLVEENSQPVDACCETVTVDPTQLSCEEPGQTPGDACVRGFTPFPLVLSGTRLYIVSMEITLADGQAINEGTRVELDCYACEGPINPMHRVFEKQ